MIADLPQLDEDHAIRLKECLDSRAPFARLRSSVGAGRCLVRSTASSSLEWSSRTTASSSSVSSTTSRKRFTVLQAVISWTRSLGTKKGHLMQAIRYKHE